MRFRRRTPAPDAPPRANPTRIAVLEYELLGIPPTPGTAAAVAIALRKAAAECMSHDPVDTTSFATPGRTGLCRRCGCSMVQDGQGNWVKA